jgi:hypothetical protein
MVSRAILLAPFETTAAIHKSRSIGKSGLFADFCCVCTSNKLDHSPEHPLSSNGPILFAGAAKVGNPSNVLDSHVRFGLGAADRRDLR